MTPSVAGLANSAVRVLFLVQRYPFAPQTFTQAEVRIWRHEGLSVTVLSFRRPPQDQRRLMGRLSHEEERRTWYLGSIGGWAWLRGLGVFLARPLEALRTLGAVVGGAYVRHNSLRLRIHSLLAWFRAIGAAGFLREGGYEHVHAEFANNAASVAWVLHRVTGVSFSFRDHLSYNPQLVLEKVRSACVVLACCEVSRRLLMEHAQVGRTNHVVTSYVGIDLGDWMPASGDGEGIVCVGTLQEKKGQVQLVRACAWLRDRGVVVECLLVGDGAGRGLIEGEIDRLGLRDCVSITGYVNPTRVRRLMADAAVVCLPSVVTSSGDSDGIPVALMEAMALRRACVSTDAGGIAELITSDVDGILVPQRDVAALAGALERLLTDRGLRHRLGSAARRTIETRFRLDVNAKESARLVVKAARRAGSGKLVANKR